MGYLPLILAFYDQWQERDYEEWLDWVLNAEQCSLELHWEREFNG